MLLCQTLVFVIWIERVDRFSQPLVFNLYLGATHHLNWEFSVVVHHEGLKRHQRLVGLFRRAIQDLFTIFSAWKQLQGSLGMLRIYRAISWV